MPSNKRPVQFIKHLDIPLKKKGFNWLWFALKVIVIVWFLVGVLFTVNVVMDFIATHDFRSPIRLQNPMPLKEIVSPVSTQSGMIRPVLASELTDEEYIRMKFGRHGDIAVAVAKTESGFREEAVNTKNTNSSVDIGLFQVNSVHWNKEGCSPKELFESRKNIDCAYKIWEASGWNAWSVFKNGSYIENL